MLNAKEFPKHREHLDQYPISSLQAIQQERPELYEYISITVSAMMNVSDKYIREGLRYDPEISATCTISMEDMIKIYQLVEATSSIMNTIGSLCYAEINPFSLETKTWESKHTIFS